MTPAPAVDPAEAWKRLRGLGELDPDRARLAQRLAAWRERRAIDRDRPRSWILRIPAARHGAALPRSARGTRAGRLELPEGIRRKQRRGDRCVSSRRCGCRRRLPPLPARTRPDPEHQPRVKRLGALHAGDRSPDWRLTPEVLATRRDLEALARGRPQRRAAARLAPRRRRRGAARASMIAGARARAAGFLTPRTFCAVLFAAFCFTVFLRFAHALPVAVLPATLRPAFRPASRRCSSAAAACACRR